MITMIRTTGTVLASMGVRLAINGDPDTGASYAYSKVDCQAFMELIFSNCGQPISYAGSNDMYRNACSWVGTLSEAKKLGYLVPGVALFIVENDGNEPAKYKADGKGNASHVGMYVGDNALTDVDKNGKKRVCDVVHSSASMGRVAGSTLKNAWTHVGLWKNVDFGVCSVDGFGVEVVGSVMIGNTAGNQASNDMESEVIMVTETYAYVVTENKEGVNFRTKTSSKSPLVARMPKIPEGSKVKVLSYVGEWAKVIYLGYTGYVMNKFLGAVPAGNGTATNNGSANTEPETILSTATEADDSVGDVKERAKRYRVYIDFKKRNDALAFQEAMQSCQVGSVK